MPKLFNTDHQPQLINPVGEERAVLPGESYEFTDEQIAAGLTGSWSETDPREGLGDEQVFKLARDSTRAQLDEQAKQLGIDPSGLGTKQQVAEAIQTALAEKAQSIEAADDAEPNPSPAESGDTEE